MVQVESQFVRTNITSSGIKYYYTERTLNSQVAAVINDLVTRPLSETPNKTLCNNGRQGAGSAQSSFTTDVNPEVPNSTAIFMTCVRRVTAPLDVWHRRYTLL